jgi:DNA-binding response OmpR family regulator
MADILIIDDDPDFRRIVARTLSAAGHQISEAKAGIGGVAAFHARHPALVITEIVMSGKEGMETIRELRREAPNLPILAVSDNIHAAFYFQTATVLGANAALEKPFSPRELLSAVAKLLPRQGQSAIGIAARSETRSTIVARPICH